MEYSIMILIVYVFIFLFGIALIRTGLGDSPPQKLRRFIQVGTAFPITGFAAGFLVTGILQSSSAVMVFTISLVAAKLIPFRQTIGVMLGTNVGTTLTLELLLFSGETLGFIMMAIGVLCLIIRNSHLFLVGAIFCGIGCMFLAMDGMSTWGQELASFGGVESLFSFEAFPNITGVLGGTALAAIIQSSTATTAIGIQMYVNHLLDVNGAIAIMMGANIGTCVTALLAALGAGRGAMQTAVANVLLNVGGVILFLPLLPFFSSLITSLTADPAAQIAHAALIYNLICSLLVLPFTTPFARVVEQMTSFIPFNRS